MNDTSRFEDWAKAYEKDMRLINGYVQSLKLLSTFEEVTDFLAEVSKDYKFRRQEVASFFGKTVDLETGKLKLIREKNGFFIVRETLLQFLQDIAYSEKELKVSIKCVECGSKKEISVKLAVTNRIRINVDTKTFPSTVAFDPIIEQVDIEGETRNLWIHIDKHRKLRKAERHQIMTNGFILAEMALATKDKRGKIGLFNFWGIDTCKECNIGQIVESKDIPVSLMKLESETSEETKQKERRKKMEELDNLLEMKMPFGEYSGKPFRWLIGFKEQYLYKLLVEMDPNEELRDFLKRIYDLAEQLDFDGYPDLLGLKRLLERSKI
ncbi:MAG: hypothetical protein D6732_13265 [Methanobacteriota archaeon]|nr:MAG: hypothetical protein D6732_13265 [Euryarchaeota archaeon]